jgi:hypothetical protein
MVWAACGSTMFPYCSPLYGRRSSIGPQSGFAGVPYCQTEEQYARQDPRVARAPAENTVPDLRTIQLLMGHECLKHTTVYLHLSRRHLHAAVNPLEQITIRGFKEKPDEPQGNGQS